MPFLKEIPQGHDGPDTAGQQFFELLDGAGLDLDALRAEIREQRFVHVALLVELDGNLVDDLKTAAFTDSGFDLFGFVRPNVIFGQNALHRTESVLDDDGVVRGTVIPKQVLQHVDRHIRAFLDELRQVLTYYASCKVQVEQMVQARVDRGRFRSHR